MGAKGLDYLKRYQSDTIFVFFGNMVSTICHSEIDVIYVDQLRGCFGLVTVNENFPLV